LFILIRFDTQGYDYDTKPQVQNDTIIFDYDTKNVIVFTWGLSCGGFVALVTNVKVFMKLWQLKNGSFN